MRGPYYLKKEDVSDFYKWQHKKIGIVLIASAISLGVIQLLVFPRVVQMYEEFNVDLPPLTQFFSQVFPIVVSLLFCYGLYLLFTQPDYSLLQAELKKYKSGEMINTKKLMNGKFEMLVLFFLGIAVAVMTFATITPIYNLTSRF